MSWFRRERSPAAIEVEAALAGQPPPIKVGDFVRCRTGNAGDKFVVLKIRGIKALCGHGYKCEHNDWIHLVALAKVE